MKKGINIWSFPQGSIQDSLKLAKAAGFEGVELALNGEGELSFLCFFSPFTSFSDPLGYFIIKVSSCLASRTLSIPQQI